MRRVSGRHLACWLLGVLPLLVGAHVRGQNALDALDDAKAPSELTLIDDLTSRVVYEFDFDEPENADPVPLYWVRIADPGYPQWNDAAFHPAAPAENDPNRSIRVPTIGGNAGVRLVAGVVPVIPEIDYHMRVSVRTEGLKRSRARVVAYLVDEDGRRIDASVASSALLNTNGSWQDAQVVIKGIDPTQLPRNADGSRAGLPAWLQVELLVEQPATWNTDPATRPRVLLEDVVGAAAYFDDLVLWRVPRIDLSSTAPDCLFLHPSAPTIFVRAQDVATASLVTNIRIYNYRSELVDETTVRISNDWQPTMYRPNLPGFGWYRAVANVSERGKEIARTWLDFASLPAPAEPRAARRTEGFGIIADDLPIDQWGALPDLLGALGVKGVSLPLWSADLTRAGIRNHRAAMSPIVTKLNADSRDITFVLNELPDELAQQARANPSLVFETFGAGSDDDWRYLEDFLVSFGQVVNRWQFGPTSMLGSGRAASSPERLQEILRRLFALVPAPQLVIPWSAESQQSAALIDSTAAGALAALPVGSQRSFGEPSVHFASILPSETPAVSATAYIGPWAQSALSHSLIIEANSAEAFGLAHQVNDLVRRTVLAWEVGAPAVAIRRPWRIEPHHLDQPMPDALFPVWRTLAEHLSGRLEHARLDLGNDVTAIVFRDAQGAGTIAVWHDSPEAEVVRASVFLGNHPVQVTDAFGNSEEVPVTDGVHEIRITREPRFIDDAVINLALLRSGFRVTPRWIEGAAAVHMHEMILTNPWNTSIAGTLRIIEPADWDIRQRVRQFSINAGEELRLPLVFSYPAYETGGPKRIVVDILLQNISTNAVRMESIVELGFKKIALTPHYEYLLNPDGQEELVITLEITNNSEQPSWLSAMVLAEGYGRLELDVARLEPGETTVRVFRLPEPATRLLNEQIRVGLRERGGSGRFNLLINAER